ncbi:MAG: LssY C-terminal domain-containing protein [Acidobacteria bacterium]|nr:LssY C-terminal domain-containing protein [Acidobacteriota bacterium]
MKRTQSACVFLLATAIAVTAQQSQQPISSQDFDVDGSKVWVDTGIDLQAGETVRLTGTGTIRYSGGKDSGPEGGPRAWLDMLRTYPLNDVPKGALLGRIGDGATSRPFLIGAKREQRAGLGGRLFVGINQMSADRPQAGAFKVKVERFKLTEQKPALREPAVKLTQKQLDSLPKRVVDAEGNQGDRVNFILVGSENQVKDALASAGWVSVDRTTKDAIFRGILASVSKQAYVTIPMSQLLMFDRPQDYGYAQGDPLRVIAARHHFRIWKAPFTVGSQSVWVGAGTHDIGFDKDQRNGKITHKIDPDTDLEREYIVRSISEGGNVISTGYMTFTDPVTEAKTAHGGSFHSDGRTAIVYFAPDVNDTSDRFADYFCSVLKQENPDTGEWGDCSQYIEDNGKTDFKLTDISKNYRILIVPGFMSSCFADSPAFEEGQQVLKTKFGMDVNLLQVPNDSSEDNAGVIGTYIRENGPKDPRKFILVGYSKGTPDLQVALAKQNIAQYTAAFISVAGASGGSVIADVLPNSADQFIRSYFKMGNCKGDLTTGFKSLRRSERQAFLGAYPNTVVPTYSIIAHSDKAGTSKALAQTWDLLTAYDKRQDGQLTQSDAIVPNSKYLGALVGDHFAVALPFDKSKDATIRSGMDKTRFPRAALLESLIRFVTHDLETNKPQ